MFLLCLIVTVNIDYFNRKHYKLSLIIEVHFFASVARTESSYVTKYFTFHRIKLSAVNATPRKGKKHDRNSDLGKFPYN